MAGVPVTVTILLLLLTSERVAYSLGKWTGRMGEFVVM